MQSIIKFRHLIKNHVTQLQIVSPICKRTSDNWRFLRAFHEIELDHQKEWTRILIIPVGCLVLTPETLLWQWDSRRLNKENYAEDTWKTWRWLLDTILYLNKPRHRERVKTLKALFIKLTWPISKSLPWIMQITNRMT